MKKDEELRHIILLPADPVDLMELQGKIHRIKKETVEKHYHFIHSHYENLEESEIKDYRLG